jgi:alpha-galactosidase
MTLWSILAAPLLAGNDVRDMSKKTLDILTNKEVIEVDRDPLGKEGTRFSKSGDQEIWTKALSKGAFAVALFNRGESEAKMDVKWSDFLKSQRHLVVRDLWKHEFIKVAGNDQTWSTTVPKHGVILLRLSTL